MPDRHDLYVNPLLGNFAVGWLQKQEAFVATKIFKHLPVDTKTGNYGEYNRADWLRDEAKERAPGSESEGGDYDIDITPEYNCKRISFHHDVDNQKLAEAQKPFNLKKDGTSFVMRKFLIRDERRWATDFFNSGKGWNDRTGVDSSSPSTNQFTRFNKSGSTPVSVIQGYCDEIAAYGFRANTILASPDVHRVLCNHTDVLGRIQYSQKGIVTSSILAELFEIKDYYVGYAVANTAAKGAAENTDFIFKNGLWIGYVDPEPSSVDTPTAGMTFAWKAYTGASDKGTRVKEFPIDARDCVRIEGDRAIDMKLCCGVLGTFLQTPLATA
jgi:hypothetical protein